MSRKEVIALANERQDSLKKLVELDAVVLLVARELGLDVSALAKVSYQNLLARVQEEVVQERAQEEEVQEKQSA